MTITERELEAMRRYLLRVDLIGGYLPQAVLPPERSRLWTLFWYGIRRLDEMVDEEGVSVTEVLAQLATLDGGADYQRSLRQFVKEAGPLMDARRRLRDILASVEAEKRYQKLGARATARDLFAVFFHKAYTPVYVLHRLMFEGESEEDIRACSCFIGTAAQLGDDLMDVVDDARKGSFWITREELAWLGIEPHQTLSYLPEIAALRERICNEYVLRACSVGARFRHAENRRRAQIAGELYLSRVLKGDFRAYPEKNKNPLGLIGSILPILPGDEALKQRFWHGAAMALERSTFRFGDLRALIRRVESSPIRCPPALLPDACVEVMSGLEAPAQTI